jgi:hypothetical protein
MSKAGADPSGRRDPDHDPGADKEGREQILRVHARDVPLDDDVDKRRTAYHEAGHAPHAYAAAGIDWPARRAVEREESAPGIPGRDGSKCLMLSPARAPRITPRSAP